MKLVLTFFFLQVKVIFYSILYTRTDLSLPLKKGMSSTSSSSSFSSSYKEKLRSYSPASKKRENQFVFVLSSTVGCPLLLSDEAIHWMSERSKKMPFDLTSKHLANVKNLSWVQEAKKYFARPLSLVRSDFRLLEALYSLGIEKACESNIQLKLEAIAFSTFHTNQEQQLISYGVEIEACSKTTCESLRFQPSTFLMKLIDQRQLKTITEAYDILQIAKQVVPFEVSFEKERKQELERLHQTQTGQDLTMSRTHLVPFIPGGPLPFVDAEEQADKEKRQRKSRKWEKDQFNLSSSSSQKKKKKTKQSLHLHHSSSDSSDLSDQSPFLGPSSNIPLSNVPPQRESGRGLESESDTHARAGGQEEEEGEEFCLI